MENQKQTTTKRSPGMRVERTLEEPRLQSVKFDLKAGQDEGGGASLTVDSAEAFERVQRTKNIVGSVCC